VVLPRGPFSMVQPFFFKIIHTCSQLHLLLRCFCATPVRVSRVSWDGGRTGVVNLADSTSWFLVDSTSGFMVSSRTRNGVWHESSKSSIGSILANFKGVSPFPGCGLESLGRDALLHSAMSESLSTCVEAIDCGEGASVLVCGLGLPTLHQWSQYIALMTFHGCNVRSLLANSVAVVAASGDDHGTAGRALVAVSALDLLVKGHCCLHSSCGGRCCSDHYSIHRWLLLLMLLSLSELSML